MKKILASIMIVVFLSLAAGCGDTKTIKGVEYDTYGLFNKDDNRNPDVKYRLVIGNIIWSVILVETIIAPIYFLGFSLYEPVGVKDSSEPKGAV